MKPQKNETLFVNELTFYYAINEIRDINYSGYNVLEQKEYEIKFVKHRDEANESFIQLTNTELFWELCTFKVYKKTYEFRKQDFFKTFIDAEEIDFLINEQNEIPELLTEYLSYLDETGYPRESETLLLQQILNRTNYKNIEISSDKKQNFINEKINKIKNPQFYQEETKEVTTETTQVKFKGNQTQLVELVKALVESEMIEGTQTNAIEQFSKFFDIEINNPNKLIQDIKGKNTDSTTAFLDLLKSNLIEYLRK
tara:strand:- start:409 stop:1173 length:765 start_codon:yes stop_codon:yes gene_type:complete